MLRQNPFPLNMQFRDAAQLVIPFTAELLNMPRPDDVACDHRISFGFGLHGSESGCTPKCNITHIARLRARQLIGSGLNTLWLPSRRSTLRILHRWLRTLFPLLPRSGGRCSAAARTGVSDCADLAPIKPKTTLTTHRAFIHALPPSLGLRFVPFSVPSVFVRWPSTEEQTGRQRQKRKKQ